MSPGATPPHIAPLWAGTVATAAQAQSTSMPAAGSGATAAGDPSLTHTATVTPLAGGSIAPTGQTYGQLPPAISSTHPKISINGKPMLCCPCTT